MNASKDGKFYGKNLIAVTNKWLIFGFSVNNKDWTPYSTPQLPLVL